MAVWNPARARFVRGLAAAVVSSMVSYAVAFLADQPVFGPTLTPVVTAALLAADKYLRGRRRALAQ